MVNLRFDFTGRVVLVTGAARGIGREIARGFHAAGATLVLVDVDERELRSGWAHEDRCVLSPGDITDVEAVQQTVDSAVERLGQIDVLINNAGVTRDGVVWRTSDQDWDLVLATHLTSTFGFIRSTVPHMRSRGFGRIINVTSYSGMHGNVGQANYAAAKAGVLGLTKTVAKEVAGFGITVNAISPNAETEMVRAIPESKLAALVEQIPQRRFAAPQEMVPAFAFLASDEAAYITGAVIPVDGGLSM